jgi:hypothetical protein
VSVTKEQLLDTICGMLDGDYDDGLDVFVDVRQDPAYRGEAVLTVTYPTDYTVSPPVSGAEEKFRLKIEEWA